MKKILIGLLIAGVLGVAVLAGGGWLLFDLFSKNTVSPEAFGSVEVGDSQAEVRDALPDAVEFTEADIYGADGTRKLPIPEGASCEHYMSSDVTNASGSVYYRFCFRDGKLVEKESVVGA